MNFDRKPAFRGAAGSRRKEPTREELLSRVKAEREERERARALLKAAVVVQKIFRGFRARQAWQQQLLRDWLATHGPKAADVAFVPSASELVEEVLPPVLHTHLPPFCSSSSGSSSSSDSSSSSSWSSSSGAEGSAALRGCFALSLRAVAAARRDPAYLPPDPGLRQQWLRQTRRLLLLCARLLGCADAAAAGPQRQLTEAAAARLAAALTRPQAACPGFAAIQQQLRRCVSRSPALAVAAARLLAGGGRMKPPLDFTGQAGQPVTGAAEAAAANAFLAAASPLEAAASGCCGGAEAAADAAAAARHLLTRLFLLPGLAAQLPPAAAELARQPAVLQLLLTELAVMAEEGVCLERSAWLRLTDGLTALFAGAPVVRELAGGRSVRLYPASSGGLQQPKLLSAWLAGATAALQAAAAAAAAAADGPETERAAEALGAPLDGTFAAGLLAALQQAPEGGIPPFCALYCALLEAVGSSQQAQGAALSALAFGCRGLLPRLWRWLAHGLGLPLEVHADASRGFHVDSLSNGARALPPEHAAALGLFCRVYSHFLIAVDDHDFHQLPSGSQQLPGGRQQLQGSFSLGHQRAIATTLNTLVFRSRCPAESAPSGGRSAGQLPATAGKLPAAAGKLLRQLYERDARRPFCNPRLWLAPYETLVGPAGGDGFSAAAVVQALLTAGADPEGLEPGGAPRPSGRPALLAALLTEAPQCVPFERRVEVFRCLAAEDRRRQGLDDPARGSRGALQLTLRRSHILEDAAEALRGFALKRPLAVSFVNAAGAEEAGLDYGGLLKEFLEEAVRAGFDANLGLMTATAEGLAYPQPAASQLPQGLALLELLGGLLGKALHEGILLDYPLAPFFVARLQGRRPSFEDLQALDAGLYRSVLELKRYEGDAEDLCLSFAVTDETFGQRKSIALVPGGESIAVTSANRLQYVQLLAEWHLNGRLGGPAAAFARGLTQVIPAAWLRLFDARELNQLLAGGEGGGVCVADWQAHTRYSGGYSEGSSTVRLFWKVVQGLSVTERQAVMKFATACSRAPLGGFQHLNPPFVIHRVACSASPLAALGGRDVERLPSASTCYNTLKLPDYRRAATLRRCLLYAATSGAGFELS